MILNGQRTVRVARRPLELFLRRVQNELSLVEADVTIRLVSDLEIARMNEAFRKKKGPTDVLSFPAGKKWRVASGEWRGAEKTKDKKSRGSIRRYLGDIAIAPETAGRNAKRIGRTLPSELRVLILHGMLHLLGYDHETDHGEMDRVERRLRRRLGLA